MASIEDREELRKELNGRKIAYTSHFEKDVAPHRTIITRDLVESYLEENFEELLAFKYKEDEHRNDRYNLIFDKSTKYYLLLALSFNDGKINIITSFVTRKHRGDPEKLIERWG